MTSRRPLIAHSRGLRLLEEAWRLGAFAAVVLRFFSPSIGLAGNAAAPPPSSVSIPAPWFTERPVHHLRLVVTPTALQSLKSDPRAYVSATFFEDNQRLGEVGLRIKGRTGSFRPVTDKPSLTIDLDRFEPGPRPPLAGVTKLHLNNSIEDPSFLHEKLGADLFLAAGLPAPAVTHAMVSLNDRPLGLYVVKEGFTEQFLARNFRRIDGNLYEPEPGPGCDINGPMHVSSGSSGHNSTNRDDLAVLASAAQEPNLGNRWERLSKLVDPVAFSRFLAMETLIGHRDGYGQARNNYRLYHDPTTDRFTYLAAGMDRLFGRADAILEPRFTGLLAQAWTATPSGRILYRRELAFLSTNVLQSAHWKTDIDEWSAQLQGSLPPADRKALANATRDLNDRLEARQIALQKLLSKPFRDPLVMTGPFTRLEGWQPMDAPTGGRLERPDIDGRATLLIAAGPKTSASWRTTAMLTPGKYRFVGRVRTKGVLPMSYGKSQGAALQVSGPAANASNFVIGDVGWTALSNDFVVTEDSALVEFWCSLRAAGGQAWFDLDSLRLIRMEGNHVAEPAIR